MSTTKNAAKKEKHFKAAEVFAEVMKCTFVQKIAWDHEHVTLENADVKVQLHIKNPELHGLHIVGEEY